MAQAVTRRHSTELISGGVLPDGSEVFLLKVLASEPWPEGATPVHYFYKYKQKEGVLSEEAEALLADAKLMPLSEAELVELAKSPPDLKTSIVAFGGKKQEPSLGGGLAPRRMLVPFYNLDLRQKFWGGYDLTWGENTFVFAGKKSRTANHTS